MKDFIDFRFEEMSQQEMLDISGGNIFEDAWEGIKNAVKTVGDFYKGVWDGLTNKENDATK